MLMTQCFLVESISVYTLNGLNEFNSGSAEVLNHKLERF